ncbi:condensation domain-containing protein [Streptomyces sp. H27-S2]|uniref:condensation domain-containing protein n=1 Tax=Streptomyces antarcticus TaxID=2996458 RepID=UPI00226E6926|nr:condensation domain-containing protein [Streptomyces sp. H27-S2]MCY0955017.1 condensation domain-containing protein [Streptomyces sp. H27-S2]
MSGAGAADGSGTVLAVVHEVAPGAPGSVLTLELRGLRDDADAERFAAWIAGRHRRLQITVEAGGPARHTLRILPGHPPRGTAPAPAPLGATLLADLLGPGPAAGEPIALTGYQRELLLEAAAGPPGRGQDLEQVYWNWSGPLDRDRFHAAWQSLCARESVLRAAFDFTTLPRLVLHPRAAVAIAHHTRTTTAWQDLLEADRGRALDPARPPLLRLAVLEGEAREPARILLTCHRALLDEYGVHLLLREFYRAYLAGGDLPGGERRPDLRDHARWLARQDSTGARELWTRTAPPARPATAVGRPAAGPGTGHSGAGRLRRHLGEPHSSRLRSWAADRGTGESSALHAAWALLLYRAAAVRGPLRVTFGVRLRGRDTALPGAAGLPGPPPGPLPLTVRVDPAAPLGELLHQVRDALLDMTAYPWVCGDLIRQWTGRPGAGRLAESAVSFDGPAELPPAVSGELAVLGVTAGPPRAAGPAAALPVTVGARHDSAGALVLDAVYDRARLADADASAVLGQCVRLLRGLAVLADPHCTVGRALDLLADARPPAMAPRPPAPRRPALSTLRRGEPSAGVLCLLAAPGVTAGGYELFARRHRGPETVVVLEWDAAPGAGVPAALTALRGPGGRLVLAGCGPGAAAAYGLARALADAGGVPVSVVMAGLAGPEDSADALARGVAALPAHRP